MRETRRVESAGVLYFVRHDQQWTSGGPLNSVSIRVHWASGPNEWLVGCSTVYLVYQTSMLLFNEVQCSDPFLPSTFLPLGFRVTHVIIFGGRSSVIIGA